MQAVAKIGKSQYLVEPGQKIQTDTAEVAAVLLVVDGDQVLVGQPEVAGAKVTVDDLGLVKGDKIRVFKFKAKSRYRKSQGFRPVYHRLEIKDIKL